MKSLVSTRSKMRGAVEAERNGTYNLSVAAFPTRSRPFRVDMFEAEAWYILKVPLGVYDSGGVGGIRKSEFLLIRHSCHSDGDRGIHESRTGKKVLSATSMAYYDGRAGVNRCVSDRFLESCWYPILRVLACLSQPVGRFLISS